MAGIVHAVTPADRPRITEFMVRHWGASLGRSDWDHLIDSYSWPIA